MDARLIVDLVVGIVGAGGVFGSIIAFIRWPSDKRKVVSEAHGEEADAVKAVSEAAVLLVQPLRDQLTYMALQVDTANAKIADLTAKLDEERAVSQNSIYVLTLENKKLTKRVQELEGRI